MLLLERILVEVASVLPPDVLMKLNFVRSKWEYHSFPLSLPLAPTQGEMSREKWAFGRSCFPAPTNWPMIVPACASPSGIVCWLVYVYWYQSGSISKMIGLVVP